MKKRGGSSKRFIIILLQILIVLIWSHPSCMGGNPAEEERGEPDSPDGLGLKFGSITLNWNDNSDNEEGFIVERKIGTDGNFEEIAQLGKDVTNFVDNLSLQESIPLSYRVRAFNEKGSSGYSNTAFISSILWSGLQDVKVVDNYAYCAFANGLLILDISNPLSPERVSSLFPGEREGTAGGLGWMTGGGAYPMLGGIEVGPGPYVYMAFGESGIKIIDVQDINNPKLASSFKTTGPANSLAIERHLSKVYAYIPEGSSQSRNKFKGLEIIDITDPLNPTLLGSLKLDDYAEGIFVDYPFAFIANNLAGLQIINIQDPGQPAVVGTYRTEDWARDVFVKGNYAYVSVGNWVGLEIIDISNPLAPHLASVYYSSVEYPSIFVSGNYAYITGYGVDIVDISNPLSPFLAEYIPSNGVYNNVFVTNGYAYITDDKYGLDIYNVSDPLFPVFVSTYETPGWSGDLVIDKKAEKTYAYVATGHSGLKIMDVTNPASPKQAGSYCGNSCEMWAVFVKDNYAFLGNWTGNGFNIVDISNPYSPTLLSSYPVNGSYPEKIFVAENYAYLAEGSSGMEIVDILDPSQPKLVKLYDTPGSAHSVYVSGNYAYIADHSSLQIVDITTPDKPSFVGSYSTPDASSTDIYVNGSYAYLLNSSGIVGVPSRLLILDISDPKNPSLAGRVAFNNSGSSWGLQVSENRVYITNGESGLQVVNVSDPTKPFIEDSYNTPGFAIKVVVENEVAYIADLYSVIITSIVSKK